MDPTPFSAALITAGEFPGNPQKMLPFERGERLDRETIILVASTKQNVD